jgi:hypothetical protein
MNYPVSQAGNYGPRSQVRSEDRMFTSPSAYRVIRRNAEQAGAHTDAPLRPEVQRAWQRLQQMPPFAREREIQGRYSQFSPEEKEMLRNGD